MDLILTKTMAGLAPADQNTSDYLAKVKLRAVLHGSFAKARNPAFLKKYFALLNLAYDMWNPGEVTSVHQDRFRHCWRSNDGVNITQDMDRRDILDAISVFSQALSFDEINRVNADNASDEEMNDLDLISLEMSYYPTHGG